MELKDLEGAPWGFMLAGAWKGHYCCAELLPSLITDATDRFQPLVLLEKSTRGLIDLPGMIISNRDIQTIELNGFDLRIPSNDYGYFLKKLEEAPVREFADGKKYHKLHGAYHCVVFTPEQRDTVLRVMRENLERVEAIADKESRDFSAAIKKVNKDGIKIVSYRDPDSLKVLQAQAAFVSKANNEKN